MTCTPASRAATLGRVEGSRERKWIFFVLSAYTNKRVDEISMATSNSEQKPERNGIILFFKFTCVTLPMLFHWESSHFVYNDCGI